MAEKQVCFSCVITTSGAVTQPEPRVAAADVHVVTIESGFVYQLINFVSKLIDLAQLSWLNAEKHVHQACRQGCRCKPKLSWQQPNDTIQIFWYQLVSHQLALIH